jgi:hypothetical protein
VAEALNIASVLYKTLNDLRPLPFPLSDSLVVLFMHDFEKPWKHVLKPDKIVDLHPQLADKSTHLEFKLKKANEVGLELSEEQLNALKYVEEEKNDYKRDQRVMNPLAAFCHTADTLSARLWPDNPTKEDDPWEGGKAFLILYL